MRKPRLREQSDVVKGKEEEVATSTAGCEQMAHKLQLENQQDQA